MTYNYDPGWHNKATSALSYLNFTSENLDDATLATLLGGWLIWSRTLLPDDSFTDTAIANCLNAYTAVAIKQPSSSKAQERLIKIFKAI